MPATVRARGHFDEPIAASVTRTSSSLDPATRTLLTQIDVPNRSGELLPGMFVYVDLQVMPTGTRWRIPATSLIFDSQGTRVAIVSGDAIHFREVEVGRDFGDVIEMQAGLDGSEVIVAQPTVSLEEGQVVTPIALDAAH
jgi:multidrug efflux pump subunit AcrA (membrane-fusion protein)